MPFLAFEAVLFCAISFLRNKSVLSRVIFQTIRSTEDLQRTGTRFNEGACATIRNMWVAMIAMLMQSTSISGSIALPPGAAPPPVARAVLLPFEYANLFNAQAQIRLDNYWEDFKASGMAQRRKELFIQFMPLAYSSALEVALSQMRRDTKINAANLIRTAAQGEFEFRGVPPGEYKLIVTANLKGTDHVWMETLQVESAPVVVHIKNRVP